MTQTRDADLCKSPVDLNEPEPAVSIPADSLGPEHTTGPHLHSYYQQSGMITLLTPC